MKPILRILLGLFLTLSLSAAPAPTTEALGASAAKELKKNLMGALSTALGKGDIAEAIDVCSTQAMPLTEKSAKISPSIRSIHRRTDKARNPANQADRLDQKAMQQFREDRSLSESSVPELEAITRYYQPLRIAPMCLTCHGDPDTFSDEVKKALQSNYAEDRATGYKEGELRGVIQVRILSAAEESAHE